MHFIDVHWWGGEEEGNKAISEVIQKQQDEIEKLKEEVRTKDQEFERRLQKLEKVSMR